MNIYKYCLLIIALIGCTSFTTASAIDRTNSISPHLKTYVKGKWVPSDTFFQKDTYCFREYTCKPLTGLRYGRNTKIMRTKSERRKTACEGPANACQCNTKAPSKACKIKLLKRR